MKPIEQLNEQTDAELIRVTLDGDMRGFDVLYKRYVADIFKNILIKVRNERETKEIVQEAFFKAYKSLKSYKGGSFSAWLNTIATNHANNCFRNKKRRRGNGVIELDDDSEWDKHDKDGNLADSHYGADPRKNIERKNLKAQLLHAIRQLSPDHQEIVVRHGIRGQSYTEIALILDVPEQTLRSRMHHARKELEGLLGDLMELL